MIILFRMFYLPENKKQPRNDPLVIITTRLGLCCARYNPYCTLEVALIYYNINSYQKSIKY